MRGLSFSRYQLERAIATHGSKYTFLRDSKDKFGEPTGSSEEVATIQGLWHVSNGYLSVKGSEGSTIRSKSTPQIVTPMRSALDIKQGDFILIGDKRYNVNGVGNLGNLDAFADISLEAVV